MQSLRNDIRDEKEPVEESLVRALLEWSDTRAHDADALSEAHAAVAGWLEAYISRAFRLSASRETRTWWSDGFVKLVLTQCSPTFIQAVGVSYWANDDVSHFYLAPFECEFHFAAPRDPQCARIVVRFGALDESGEIARLSIERCGSEIMASRPTENSRWAFAIEMV